MLHISMNTAKKYNIMPPRHKISEQKSRQCCIFFEETKKLQQLSVSRAVFESAVGAML